MSDRFFINMPIPADRYEAVCAVLAGTALSTTLAAPAELPKSAAPKPTPAPIDAGQTRAAEQSQPSGAAEASPPATDVASDPNDIDAHGHPWNPELHAGTKGKTKDGLWRMKVGVSRPDPLPGFPTGTGSDTGTSSETATPSATSQGATAAAGAPAATSTEDDDEFAAFRAAAAASDATDATAAASVPARQYSDADLGALCNQAAVKLGDPNPVKAVIASFTPEGQVAHSRNIPAERRAEFVAKVEEAAGITFAG